MRYFNQVEKRADNNARGVDAGVCAASFAALIPFCEPTYFANCLPLVDKTYMVLELLVLVYVGYKLLRDRPLSKGLIAVLILQTYLVVVTAIFGGRTTSTFKALLDAVGVFLVVETFYAKDFKSFLVGGTLLYSIIAVASLCSVFLFPDGLYRGNNGIYSSYYLYGHKNDILFNLFPGLIFAMLYSIKEGSKLSFAVATVFTAIVFANVYVLHSATSSLACVILYCCFLLARKGNLVKINGIVLIAIVAFVFWFILTGGVQALFSGFFDAMDRDLTFSSRTFIWERAINAISQQPYFGYGAEELALTQLRFGGFSTPHNFVLAELFYGGAVGVLLIVVAVGSCVAGISRVKKSAALSFLAAALLVLFVMSTMESMGIGLVKFAAVLALISTCSMLESQRLRNELR